MDGRDQARGMNPPLPKPGPSGTTSSHASYPPGGSSSSVQTTGAYASDKRSNDKGKRNGKSRWLHKMTDWLSVGEPSTRALKHHKKEVFAKAGISKNDPEAGTKLHVPIGEIPSHAIRPSGSGPDPEDVLRKEAERKKKSSMAPRGGSTAGSRVSSSASRRSERSRVENDIFPFD